jgi:hypothetical protein
MNSLRRISLATALVASSACAQAPSTPLPGKASPPAAMAERMSKMDAHMKAMREMHDKMARARTPEERNALMADHMKLMQDGMAMMGGMGPGGMHGMGGDMAGHQQMMEKRMEMMQSMMQMMMDRMPAAPPSK